MQEISNKMDEFLDKVDALCWEYGYEIHPPINEWTENGITVIGNGEIIKLHYIDGDGRGK